VRFRARRAYPFGQNNKVVGNSWRIQLPNQLDVGSCLVCWASTETTSATTTGWWLDDAERRRAAAFHQPADATRFIAGRHLTRAVLARLTGRDPRALPIDRTCETCGEQHGRPRLADDESLSLSVSHSAERIAVAVGRGCQVGVDVEAVEPRQDRDDLEAMIKTCCTAAESAVIAALPPAQRAVGFLSYWTRKEAVVKATGEGLREPLDHLEVSAPDQAPALLGWRGRPDMSSRARLFAVHPGAGYLAALCAIDATTEVAEEYDATPFLR
jgi:4'-phosphopantetheinyl transferase